MAFRRKRQVPEEGSEGRSSSGMKAFLAVLLVLDVVAATAFGYFSLVERDKVQRDFNRSRSGLFRLKELAEILALQTDRIKQDELEKVDVPMELVYGVANSMRIADKLDVKSGSERRWKRSNIYLEKETQVTFREKEGYHWRDLMRFLQSIEKANPKVQVKSINFGSRDEGEGEGSDIWRPLSMVVRVFSPSEK